MTHRQLTLDGREVRHPPAPRRVKCPGCEKTVSVTIGGTYRQHRGWGSRALCQMSGLRARP